MKWKKLKNQKLKKRKEYNDKIDQIKKKIWEETDEIRHQNGFMYIR